MRSPIIAADVINTVDPRMRASALRISEATPDHSPFLARCILSASRSQLKRGPFDIALGLETADLLDILEFMSLSDFIGNCHFSKFFVAEMSGEPVGALSAHDPGESGLMPLGAALSDAYTALGHDEEKLPSVLQRIESVQRCLPPAQPETWIVEWVAVEKAHRRQGIVGHLLQKTLASGVHRSLLRSQVSTYVGNEAAIGAYAKAGFCVNRERHDPDFEALLGVGGMVTMVRDYPDCPGARRIETAIAGGVACTAVSAPNAQSVRHATCVPHKSGARRQGIARMQVEGNIQRLHDCASWTRQA